MSSTPSEVKGGLLVRDGLPLDEDLAFQLASHGGGCVFIVAIKPGDDILVEDADAYGFVGVDSPTNARPVRVVGYFLCLQLQV